MMQYETFYRSPLGEMMLTGNDENLTGLWIAKQKYYAATSFEKNERNDDLRIFLETKKWLDNYFQGQKPSVSSLSLAPQGGEFRQAVWEILKNIPYGELLTYGDIAKEISCKKNCGKMSAQAVGGAVGHNPISIIIPCHRVVGAKGNLTGYAGGLDLKIKLLKHEGVDMSQLFLPKKIVFNK